MKEKKRTFREWRNEAMIKAVAGDTNQSHAKIPAGVLQVLAGWGIIMAWKRKKLI
jgi:hypothetical protein